MCVMCKIFFKKKKNVTGLAEMVIDILESICSSDNRISVIGLEAAKIILAIAKELRRAG